MVVGYVKGYASVLGRRKNIRGRGESPQEHKWLWRAFAIVILGATLLGTGVTYFIGVALDNDLKNLAFLDNQKEELLAENRKLNAQRDKLLEPQRIEERAAKAGLYPPGPNQVRRP